MKTLNFKIDNTFGRPRIFTEEKGRKKIILNFSGDIDDEESEIYARLIAAAPETAAERDKLKEINAELLEALEKILKHIDDQTLVRNIEKDHKPNFEIRQLPLIMDLKQAINTIAKAKSL